MNALRIFYRALKFAVVLSTALDAVGDDVAALRPILQDFRDTPEVRRLALSLDHLKSVLRVVRGQQET